MTKQHEANGIDPQVLADLEACRQRSLEACARKRRYPDEFVARAVGIELMTVSPEKRYVYECRWCRGWHITRQKQGRPSAAAEYYYLQEVMK